MSSAGFVSNVRQSGRTLGVELPAAIGEQLAAAEDLVAKADEVAGSRASLVDAALDAIAAGKDYRADKTVTAGLLDSVLADLNIRAVARERADRGTADALVEQADNILASWSDALTPWSVKLVEAAQALPDDDLDNMAAIKSAGVDAYTHLGNAQHARKLWFAAVSGFLQIALAARIGVPDKRLILTAADAGNIEPDPWLLARNAIPLEFVRSIGDFMERSTIREQRRQAALDDEQQPPRRKAAAV